jgi:hypothetical protein
MVEAARVKMECCRRCGGMKLREKLWVGRAANAKSFVMGRDSVLIRARATRDYHGKRNLLDFAATLSHWNTN